MKLFLIIIFFFILFSSQEIFSAPASVDVPLRHWSYDAVEKLAILNLSDIADIGARPVSRVKMAYIIKTAIEKSREYELEFDWAEQEYLETVLYNLIEEFREELVSIGVEIVSVEEGTSEKRIFGSPEVNVEKIYARLDTDTMFLENKDGWKLKDGMNIRAKITMEGNPADFCAVSLTPGIRYSRKDTDVDFENAQIRLVHPGYNMELSAGRSSMWWGPGFYGSFLMTDNAFPPDMVKWNNIRPFSLPWVLKKIGRFNAQMFVSRLEKNRAIPHAYLTGWRLDYTPLNFMKFGFGHIMMFGGKGVKKLGFSNFLSSSSLVFSPAGGGVESENHIISGDAQLFLRRVDRFFPIATGIKLYTEWGAEDEEGNVPIDLASVTGAYLMDFLKIPGFDIKMEFAKFHKVFYNHFKYGSGYTYRDNIIGYNTGGDSESVSAAAIFSYPGQYKLSAAFSHQRAGISLANVETTNELRLEFTLIDALNMYNIRDVGVSMFYEIENIENYNNTVKKVRNQLVGVEINKKF